MKKSPLAIHDANLWVNCTGSVALSEKFPAIESGDGVSEARLEGRAFHETSQYMLENAKTKGLVSWNDRDNVVGTLSNDGIVTTDEIYDSAVEYVTDVIDYCTKHDMLKDLHIEQFVDTGHLSTDTYGYVDAWVFNPKKMTLTAWEGKYGHRYVDVFENWQLICYVSGILQQMAINGKTDQMITVEMRVAQPRCFTGGGTIRSWQCKASDLRAHVNTVIANAHEARNDGKCIVGNWCHDCPGRYACTTLQRVNYQGIDYQSSAEGVSLHGSDLACELKILNRAEIALKARKSGLEAQAISEHKNGQPVPGFTTEQGYGRKRWKKGTPTDEVIAMGDMMDIDLRKPVELDTPTQALKKGIDESVIIEYSETPLGKVKLVEFNETRARQVFSAIKGK